MQKSIDSDLQGVDVRLSGYVSSLPSNSDLYSRFILDVIQLRDMNASERNNPGKIRLYWYRPYPVIIPGQHMNLIVRLKQPHGVKNPGGFDYEAWLFKEGIRATGYIRGIDNEAQLWPSRINIHTLRYHLRNKLEIIFKDSDQYFGLILALLIGDRSKIKSDQQDVLIRTGTGHLLAISGLHIGFVFMITRWLWPLLRPNSHSIPAQQIAAICSVLVALGYAILSGLAIPAQRAVLMLFIVLMGRLLFVRIKIVNALAFAMIVVLFLNPMSVISAGFWLSFSAVALILYVLQAEQASRNNPRFLFWCSIQFWICLGLSPVTAIWFNQVSLWSVSANMIAIPWISLITLPLLLAAMSISFAWDTLSEIVLGLATWSLELLWRILEFLDDSDLIYHTVATPSLLALALAIAALGIMILPQAFRNRVLAGFGLLPIFFPSIDVPLPGEFDVIVLDVGQGLSVAVKTHRHLLLYDTGPGNDKGYDSGRSIVIPYLRHSGLNSIDMIVQSHGDNDHIGGLNSIIEGIKVYEVLSSVPDSIAHENSKLCHTGQSWTWDGIRFEILHPVATHDFQGNNASCVLKVTNQSLSVLLTGDIERQAELSLVARNNGNLSVPVLLVPHHGSITSSSFAFIRSVSASQVVFSSGYLNRFRLPNQDIIRRYESHGAEIFNTATDGAISIKSSQGQFVISTERQRTPRFWNH
jgi:competence protein ComEC